jgi:predicted DNA-binding transcriptional regulator AlpA
MREPAATRAAPGEFEPFLTAREVAERLRIAPCTVLRYYGEGVLPGQRLRVGPRHPVRFRWSEIEAALLERRQ